LPIQVNSIKEISNQPHLSGNTATAAKVSHIRYNRDNSYNNNQLIQSKQKKIH